MELKKNVEGLVMGSRIGMIKIENDPKKFDLYKKLGLDVFNDSPKKSNRKRKESTDTDGEDNDQ